MGNVIALGTGDPAPYIRTATVVVTFSNGKTEGWSLQGDIMTGRIEQETSDLGHPKISFIFDAPSNMRKL